MSNWWNEGAEGGDEPGRQPRNSVPADDGFDALDSLDSAGRVPADNPYDGPAAGSLRPSPWHIASPLLAALSFGFVAFRNGHRRLAFAQMLVSAAFGIAALTVWYNDYWVHIAITEWYLIIALASVFLVCGVAGAAAVVQWRDCEHWRAGTATLWGARLTTAVAVLVVAAPAAAATYVIEPQIQVARHSFVSAPAALPHELENPTGTEPAGPFGTDPAIVDTSMVGTNDTTTSPSTSSVPDTVWLDVDTGPVAELVDVGSSTRTNVLLLGGDAGPGRWNLRTDSMNLVSIDTATGDSAIIGIPRNLLHAPLPPGALKAIFPNGYTDLMNALFVWGTKHTKAVKNALGDTDVPGATLVTASLAELLGVRIDAWVLVDMAGFIDLIDAFGGLDVYVPKKVPAPGNVPAGKHRLPRSYSKGWHEMDGTDALAFARTRHADSDYYRMARQRCLLASIADQKGASAVAKHWPAVSKVIAKRLRTNLTSSLLKRILKLAGSGVNKARSVALTPPLVPSGRWNAKTVRQIVADTISNSGKYAPKSTTATGPDGSGPTTTTKIGEAPVSGAAANIDEVCRTHR